MAVELARKSTRDTAGIPLQRVGVWLVVASFVLAQFVEFTLLDIGGFDLSLQKVVALVVFPVAFLFIGHIRLNLPLSICLGAVILANSAAYLAEGDPLDVMLLSANVTAMSGFLGATILYTVLVRGEGGFHTLARMWIAFAVVTSVLVLGQSAGLLPLWAVSGESLEYRAAEVGGLYRGTGLRFDPNFQALVLVLGLVFARFYSKRIKVAVMLVIMLGVAATFSRMGVLVTATVLIIAPVAQTWASSEGRNVRFSRLLGTGVVTILSSFGAYALAPQVVRSYVEQRTEDLVNAYYYLAAGGARSAASAGLTSAEERILLFDSALRVYSDNFLVGVGAYKAPEFLYLTSGIDKTVHNSYLEALLAGGVFGVLAIFLYVGLAALALYKSRRAGGDAQRWSFTFTFLAACGLISLFLTINYNSIFWLPLVLALADSKLSAAERSRSGHQGSTDSR